MRVDGRDFACGAIIAGIGLFFAVHAWMRLRIGEAFAMGPGYFPLMLGAVLALLGAGIAVRALGRDGEAVEMSPAGWRGVALTIAAVGAFGATARGLGMLPALFIASMIASLAPQGATWRASLALSAVLTAFSIGIFVLALRLPYPIIGVWLKG